MAELYGTVLLLSCMFALYLLSKTANRISVWLTCLFIAAVGLSMFQMFQALARSAGFLYSAGILLAFAATIPAFKRNPKHAVLMLAVTFPVFLAHLFRIMSWPFVVYLEWMHLISLISFIMLLLKSRDNVLKEHPYLVIIGTEALIRLVMIWNW